MGDTGQNYSDGAILLLYDPKGKPSVEANITVQISVSNAIQGTTIVSGGSGYSSSVQGFIIPGNAGAIGEAVFSPKEGHGFNILTELCANTAIINIRLSDSGQYFLKGETYAFRQVSLITDIVEKDTFIPAYNPLYLGPSHQSYGSGLLKSIDPNKGYVLYINNLKKVIRSDGQEEDLKICLTF